MGNVIIIPIALIILISIFASLWKEYWGEESKVK